MILYTHNNKLVKIRSGLNAGKLIEKYVAPAPTFDEVTIGTQTWMSKNLAIDDGQGGISSNTVNYGHGDVVEYYYTWDAAVRVAESINGWHLPSADEVNVLVDEVGGLYTANKLKSSYGWSSGNGTDNYGFAAFPAGFKSQGTFIGFRDYSVFWTGTPGSSTSMASSYYFNTSSKIQLSNGGSYRVDSYCVRLIKDS